MPVRRTRARSVEALHEGTYAGLDAEGKAETLSPANGQNDDIFPPSCFVDSA